MAIGKKESGFLTKFWESNQNLILASLYSLSLDQDKETRDSITTVLGTISSSSRDRSLINIEYKNKVHVKGIKKADLGFQTVKLLEELDLINDDVFNLLLKDKSCSFLLLKKKEDMTETERKYKKYRIQNSPEFYYKEEGYYVA